tara:strand:- start:3080 stop:3721 length:642 start_codon:yes stop_codon:yes gene_type:complete
MKKKDLPNKIPVFPLSNFIIFPSSTVPLNIFEPRYLQMVDETMRESRLIGMIQPKKTGALKKPNLYDVGCAGKIVSFNETDDGRYLIVLNGICRFRIIKEIQNEKLYRECSVNFEEYKDDLDTKSKELSSTKMDFILNSLKSLYKRQGYTINWKDIENQSSDKTIDTLSMASPFTLEEKQILIETVGLDERAQKLEDILKTYIRDDFSNKTIQ